MSYVDEAFRCDTQNSDTGKIKRKDERLLKDSSLKAAFEIVDILERSQKSGVLFEIKDAMKFEATRHYRHYVVPRFFRGAIFALIFSLLGLLLPYLIPYFLLTLALTNQIYGSSFYSFLHIRGVGSKTRSNLNGILFGRTLSFLDWIAYLGTFFMFAWTFYDERFKKAQEIGSWMADNIFQKPLFVWDWVYKNTSKLLEMNIELFGSFYAAYLSIFLFIIVVRAYEHIIKFSSIPPKIEKVKHTQPAYEPMREQKPNRSEMDEKLERGAKSEPLFSGV